MERLVWGPNACCVTIEGRCQKLAPSIVGRKQGAEQSGGREWRHARLAPRIAEDLPARAQGLARQLLGATSNAALDAPRQPMMKGFRSVRGPSSFTTAFSSGSTVRSFLGYVPSRRCRRRSPFELRQPTFAPLRGRLARAFPRAREAAFRGRGRRSLECFAPVHASSASAFARLSFAIELLHLRRGVAFAGDSASRHGRFDLGEV